MTDDKRTIGLTARNRDVIEQMTASGFFKDQMDCAKFALSVAINSNAPSTQVEGAETVWNVGSLDPDGEIKSLLPALFPGTETPYRLAESLINSGLDIIGRGIERAGSFDIAMYLPQDTAPSS